MPRFRSWSRLPSTLFAAAAAVLLATAPALAQVGSDRYAAIVVDAGTGNVLSASSADEMRYPASLTKMMTLYMLFDALRDRRVSLDQQVPVSNWAASMSPTKLGLVPGMSITVEQAILGLVTKSANDAAAALGEMLGGDEERFAQMMTLRARALGMTRTTFRNASGLPDPDQMTTARDMATLARHLVQDHPAYYRYFSTPSFVFHGRFIPNHQTMLQTYPGADGLKTGWIRDSGYNLVTSAVHGDARMIGVVLGAANAGERDAQMAMQLDDGFSRVGAPMMLARRDPAPGFRMPSIISAAQAAPSYGPPPLYSAPYLGCGAWPLPGRSPAGCRSARRRAASACNMPDDRGRAVTVRMREPGWREQQARIQMPEPGFYRMGSRPDPRDRYDARATRFAVRPILAAPSVRPRAQPTQARAYEAPPRVIRPTHAGWPSGRYPS